jgi:hypothetical protein
MADNRGPKGTLGAILGALLVVALGIFLLSGGEYFGKRTVDCIGAGLKPARRGAESALGGPSINGNIFAAAIHRAERKLGAATPFGCRFLEKILRGGWRSRAAAAVDHHFGKGNLSIR